MNLKFENYIVNYHYLWYNTDKIVSRLVESDRGHRDSVKRTSNHSQQRLLREAES